MFRKENHFTGPADPKKNRNRRSLENSSSLQTRLRNKRARSSLEARTSKDGVLKFKNKTLYKVSVYHQIDDREIVVRTKIIKAIHLALCTTSFKSRLWKSEGQICTFFVDERTVRKLNEAIWMEKLPMSLEFMVSGNDLLPREPSYKNKLLQTLKNLYDRESKVMHLERFCQRQNARYQISDDAVMRAVLCILEMHFEDLEALNLRGNRLSSLRAFSRVENRLPGLKILDLADNKIPSLAMLKIFKNLKLVDLNLAGNPLQCKFRSKDAYVAVLRGKFPHLQKLDGDGLEGHTEPDFFARDY